MSWQTDMRLALIGSPALNALVGSAVWETVADSATTAPYVVYQTVSTGGETTHDGDRSLEFPSIQITAWATTAESARNVASKVNAVLDGKTLIGSSKVSFQLSGQSSSYDQETRLFGEIIEYTAAANRN